jgi:ketosteroid isomerase-like protein
MIWDRRAVYPEEPPKAASRRARQSREAANSNDHLQKDDEAAMKRSAKPLLLALATLALSACGTTPSITGASLPPELQRVLDDYTTAWKARDAKALAALFPDNQTVVPNACPPATTRAEVEKCYTGSGGDLNLRALDHRIDGQLAYIIGEYAMTPGGPAGGKFVLTLQKDASGRWLIVSDMDREYPRQPRAQ